jgi:hypothetical protein
VTIEGNRICNVLMSCVCEVGGAQLDGVVGDGNAQWSVSVGGGGHWHC